MLVNGEHRIGIYACKYTHFIYILFKRTKHIFILTATKILEGEELFINYGPSFFPTDTKEKEEELTLSPAIHYSEDASDSTYFEDSDLD